jgi:hypothetical protein
MVECPFGIYMKYNCENHHNIKNWDYLDGTENGQFSDKVERF